jgi:hypothetical protein
MEAEDGSKSFDTKQMGKNEIKLSGKNTRSSWDRCRNKETDDHETMSEGVKRERERERERERTGINEGERPRCEEVNEDDDDDVNARTRPKRKLCREANEREDDERRT